MNFYATKSKREKGNRNIPHNASRNKSAADIEDYPYSSFKEYVSRPKIVDTEYILKMRDLERFIKFNKIKNDDKCLDIDARKIVRAKTGDGSMS